MANQLKFMDDANPERREPLAAKVPRTSTEFRQVHGVGEAKLEAYGALFLRAIGEWEGC